MFAYTKYTKALNLSCNLKETRNFAPSKDFKKTNKNSFWIINN